jgi:mono/diheme cytochrome c family protein
MNRLLPPWTVLSCLGAGLALIGALLAYRPPTAVSADSADVLTQSYTKQIQPLLVRTCGKCHGKTPKGNDLDLTNFTTAKAILAKPKVLADVAERLSAGDMPPKDAPQLSEAERKQLLDWIRAALDAEAADRAGDPGPVTLRRLTNAEYDNAVRDLTGVDMRPTRVREFPADSVGGEGFANVGEAMPVTPGLVERYHQAARDIAARAVLLPKGFRFSSSPDRPSWTAEAIEALRSFHARYAGPKGEPPLAAHLAATLRHRGRLARGPAAIAAVAAEEKLNATYLAALWAGLSNKAPSPLLDPVREKWREATTDPVPILALIKATQDQLFLDRYKKNAVLAVGNGFPAWEDLRRVVAKERVDGAAREPVFRLVALPVAPAQPNTYVVWDRLRLEGGDGPALVLAEHPELRAAVETASGLKFGQHPKDRPVPKSALVTSADAEVIIDLRKLPAPLQKALTLPRFLRADVSLDNGSPETASVQAFLLAATGGGGNLAEPVAKATPGDPRVAQIVHPKVAAERAKPAAEFRALFPPAVLFEPIVPRDAQGSLFMYHREDEPLRRLLLDGAGQAEIDRLWRELQFVSEQAFATPRMYEEIVQYYRKPNDGARIMFFYIQQFGERVKREEEELRAAQAAAEPGHLEALLAFAARAWRRPLTADERKAILASYHDDRKDGVKHDPAFRAALARVLSSPWFLYRVEQPATGPRWRAVNGDELATRLSFLLWESIPDDELRAKAATLHEPAVMEQQLRRMLKDSRIRGMAEEFGARWLGVRDFSTNHGRSLKHFPEFTAALRDALAEEPVRFFEDLLMNDRPVADLIDADAVVVNDILAKHYGIPGVKGAEWRRVEKVAVYGRGGILGFGAVLAKQAAAARTSPVKRGAWVVQMLGERLPKVPPDVPPLPESPPAGLSVREITERHRKDPNCAGCHIRIDPYGMALERFDAIGRLRPARELKPGDTKATLRDGNEIDDFAGLRKYLAGPRREDLLRALAQKLTGYALGRSVQLSDRKLVDELTKSMAGGGRWSDALLIIVRSEQFRCIRPEAAAPP